MKITLGFPFFLCELAVMRWVGSYSASNISREGPVLTCSFVMCSLERKLTVCLFCLLYVVCKMLPLHALWTQYLELMIFLVFY